MNRVQQRIYQEIVAPALKNMSGLRIGQIRNIDYRRKMAVVAYTDSQKDTDSETVEVSLVRHNGIHEAGPFIGDTVLLGFMNNNLRTPIIIGPVEEAYDQRRRVERDRHENQGALVSDLYTQRTGATWNV